MKRNVILAHYFGCVTWREQPNLQQMKISYRVIQKHPYMEWGGWSLYLRVL